MKRKQVALEAIIRKWRSRLNEFDKASIDERKRGSSLDGSRYEGIATATRWAIEDMERTLKRFSQGKS